jgi:hypothetical protein
MLQDDDVLGPYLAEALHRNPLEYVAGKHRTMAHDLIASSSIEAVPVRDASRPGILEVIRHA